MGMVQVERVFTEGLLLMKILKLRMVDLERLAWPMVREFVLVNRCFE